MGNQVCVCCKVWSAFVHCALFWAQRWASTRPVGMPRADPLGARDKKTRHLSWRVRAYGDSCVTSLQLGAWWSALLRLPKAPWGALDRYFCLSVSCRILLWARIYSANSNDSRVAGGHGGESFSRAGAGPHFSAVRARD